jgi:hypothetical protein
MIKDRSAFLEAIAIDQSVPMDPAATALWMADLKNAGRWFVRPLVQLVFAVLLHLVWFVKRLPLPQFRAHATLQKLICWFCTHLVSMPANQLILRHFATESNILNFLRDNVTAESGSEPPDALSLYPKSIDDMHRDSFVEHDQELFRMVLALAKTRAQTKTRGQTKTAALEPAQPLSWQHWQPIVMADFDIRPRRTQVMDFETAHALFMCLFCLLLTRDEYRDAINGFNLDQSIAIQVGKLIGDTSLSEYAYNKYPHYLVGPWNLTQRFIMHGFFTEYLYARLEQERVANKAVG